MKSTIDMARKAGFNIEQGFLLRVTGIDEDLERLVALVRADEAEKYKWDVHSCGPTCIKAACVAIREAVEAEREACWRLCDELWQEDKDAHDCREAIRARGNT